MHWFIIVKIGITWVIETIQEVWEIQRWSNSLFSNNWGSEMKRAWPTLEQERSDFSTGCIVSMTLTVSRKVITSVTCGCKKHCLYSLSLKGPNIKRECTMPTYCGSYERLSKSNDQENWQMGSSFIRKTLQITRFLVLMVAVCDCGFKLVDPPTCLPDLAPTDYRLVPNM